MGAVHRAVDCDLRREVAIKFMLSQADADKKLRFIEEAQITGQLEHPHIVPIHELGADSQQRLYFAMKMVQGRSLAQVLDALRNDPKSAEKQYPLSRLLTILVNVCHAVSYAHARGVIHRDLKPANVMLGDFGEVYVMDWGLAKVLKSDGGTTAPRAAAVPVAVPAAPGESVTLSRSGQVVTSRAPEADLTVDGSVLGTPVYMAPEQATGDVQAIGPRTDVYALGAILYEMLTLQPPVNKEGGALAVLPRVALGEIVAPEQRNPQRARAGKVPKELAAVALKALSRNPSDRYPGVEALRRDVELYLEGRSVSAKQDTFKELAWKLVKRNRGASVTAGIAAAVLAAILWFSFQAILRAKGQAEAHLASLQKEQEDRRQQGKASAPLFVADARQSGEQERLDYALAQVNVALEYDPASVDGRLLKGQLLIVKRDFAAAEKVLAPYVQQRPQDKEAAALLMLCRVARPDDARQAHSIAQVFFRQRLFGLADQMEKNRDNLLRLYRLRIDEAWPGQGEWLELKKDKFWLDLSGCTAVKDLTPLDGMPLDVLYLNSCSEVRDLRPLQRGKALTDLSLHQCKKVRDLTPLQSLPLKRLNLNHCDQFTHLADLQGMQLNRLTLKFLYYLEEVTPLKDMPLTTLDLAGCKRLTSIAPLAKLPLVDLNLSHCSGIKDLTTVGSMKTLKKFSFPDSPNCKDLSVLESLPGLEHLELYGCLQLDDFKSLHKLKKLQVLSLRACRQVRDLKPFAGLPLTRLDLSECDGIDNLEPLRNMPLKELDLRDTRVKDLSPLKDMKLTKLCLRPQSLPQGLEVLWPMQKLRVLLGQKTKAIPVAEFKKKYEAGDFGK
jgi:serine/threonine protein kinase